MRGAVAAALGCAWVVTVGCGRVGFDAHGPPDASTDARADASRDARVEAAAPDAPRLDAPEDVRAIDVNVPPPTDAGEFDATTDAGSDANELDATTDAGSDANDHDAGELDAGDLDGGELDGGEDPPRTICTSATTCVCPASAICFFACPGGNCDIDCEPGSQCDVTCTGDGCDVDCQTGASCVHECVDDTPATCTTACAFEAFCNQRCVSTSGGTTMCSSVVCFGACTLSCLGPICDVGP